MGARCSWAGMRAREEGLSAVSNAILSPISATYPRNEPSDLSWNQRLRQFRMYSPEATRNTGQAKRRFSRLAVDTVNICRGVVFFFWFFFKGDIKGTLCFLFPSSTKHTFRLCRKLNAKGVYSRFRVTIGKMKQIRSIQGRQRTDHL